MIEACMHTRTEALVVKDNMMCSMYKTCIKHTNFNNNGPYFIHNNVTNEVTYHYFQINVIKYLCIQSLNQIKVL